MKLYICGRVFYFLEYTKSSDDEISLEFYGSSRQNINAIDGFTLLKNVPKLAVLFSDFYWTTLGDDVYDFIVDHLHHIKIVENHYRLHFYYSHKSVIKVLNNCKSLRKIAFDGFSCEWFLQDMNAVLTQVTGSSIMNLKLTHFRFRQEIDQNMTVNDQLLIQFVLNNTNLVHFKFDFEILGETANAIESILNERLLM
jgi:hypothetical protein